MWKRARTGSESVRIKPLGIVCKAPLVILLFATLVHGEERGLVVSRVDDAGAARMAGLAEGDVLLTWRLQRDGAAVEGRFSDPLSAYWVESEWGNRASVKIDIARSDRSATVTVPIGDWRIATRPVLTNSDRQIWEALRSATTLSERSAALEQSRRWYTDLIAEDRLAEAAWLSSEISNALLGDGQLDAAWKLALRPLGDATPRLPLRDRVTLLERHGTSNRPGRSSADYRRSLQRAVELQRTVAEDFRLAKLLVHLSAALGRGGEVDAAIAALLEANALALETAPNSLVSARSHANLGIARLIQGQHAVAEHDLDTAIGIYRRLGGPAVDTLGGVLSNRGILSYRRGELAQAQSYYEQSLVIARASQPGTSVEAKALNNLSLVLRDRGDLLAARALLVDALTINRGLDSSSVSITRNLSNLATIELELGDVDSALQHRQEIVSTYEQRLPDSTELAYSYLSLARIADFESQETRAVEYFQQALAQMARVAPDSVVFADVGAQKAAFHVRKGHHEAARPPLEQALAILERLAPDSLQLAEAKVIWGHLLSAEGNDHVAEAAYIESLQIQSRDAANAASTALTYYSLGQLAARKQDKAEALRLFERAVSTLELQRGRLPSGDQLQRFFSDRYRHVYTAYMELLLGEDRIEEALEVTEKYRARSLLSLLASRDLNIATAEQAQERERLRDAYARVADRLSAPQEDHLDYQTLLAQQRQLRLERAALDDRIRQRAIERTETASADAGVANFRQNLKPGTLAVSFFFGDDKLYIFSMRRHGPIRLDQSSADASTIKEEIRRYRRLLSRGRHDPDAMLDLNESGRRLYQFLLADVGENLADTDRLLIVPDRELFSLPFAALVSDRVRNNRYLVEEVALQFVQSLAIFSELEGQPASQASLQLAAFAYSGRSDTVNETRHDPSTRLQFTKREVAAIAEQFDKTDASLFVGDSATEQRVREVAGSARYLHFATHAQLDAHQPLNSSLSLSPSDAHDGRLQGWEVFDNLDLSADLVTLSACETGAGQMIPSEGFQSLARMFQLTGARNVVAALWGVPDEATATLMTEFYRALAGGLDTPEALRAAQLAVLNGTASRLLDADESVLTRFRRWLWGQDKAVANHPYYWAAFQPIGPGQKKK